MQPFTVCGPSRHGANTGLKAGQTSARVSGECRWRSLAEGTIPGRVRGGRHVGAAEVNIVPSEPWNFDFDTLPPGSNRYLVDFIVAEIGDSAALFLRGQERLSGIRHPFIAVDRRAFESDEGCRE